MGKKKKIKTALEAIQDIETKHEQQLRTMARLEAMGRAHKLSQVDPTDLKKQGFRFHHFLDKKTGAILATLVTQSDPLGSTIKAAVAVCAVGDVGSRKSGRAEALMNLALEEKTKEFSQTVLRTSIRDRTILKFFSPVYPGPRRLRPAAPFVPKQAAVAKSLLQRFLDKVRGR